MIFYYTGSECQGQIPLKAIFFTNACKGPSMCLFDHLKQFMVLNGWSTKKVNLDRFATPRPQKTDMDVCQGADGW
jgi:hypothetical protein